MITEKQKQELKQIANFALSSQNACNLSGIVHAFSDAIKKLRAIYPDKPTEFYNKHPISRLYAEQISFLASSEYSTAYAACIELAK